MLPRNVTVGPRVQLHLHAQATLREYRELREFARFCIEAIEKDIGRADRWTIKITPNGVCYSGEVIVEHRGAVIRTDGTGFDGAVAGRDAFCKVDKLLRENCVLADVRNPELARVAR